MIYNRYKCELGHEMTQPTGSGDRAYCDPCMKARKPDDTEAKYTRPCGQIYECDNCHKKVTIRMWEPQEGWIDFSASTQKLILQADDSGNTAAGEYRVMPRMRDGKLMPYYNQFCSEVCAANYLHSLADFMVSDYMAQAMSRSQKVSEWLDQNIDRSGANRFVKEVKS